MAVGETTSESSSKSPRRWLRFFRELEGPSRPLWRPLGGLALGLILLAVSSRGIDTTHLLTGLRQADPVWIGLSLLLILLTTALKAVRWRDLFSKDHRPGLLPLGKALLIGQLVNALVPSRAGDLARVYLIGARERAGKATVLGTVALEKLLDLTLLLICAGLASALAPLPPWLDVSLLAMAIAGLLLLFAAMVLPRQKVLGWLKRRANSLPWDLEERLTGTLERMLGGLTCLRSPSQATPICIESAAVWALAAGTNLVLFWAFDLNLPPGAALWLLVLLQVGVAPPSSPGRVGVFHALTVVGLSTFGVDRASALVYGTTLHALVYLPQVVLGSAAALSSVWGGG